MFVTPKPGLRVLDPKTKRALPEVGKEVPETV
jgi:hypothetical protein